MLASRSKLIASIIKKKLYEDVDQILSISRQGFDVFAQVDFPEVQSLPAYPVKVQFAFL